MTLTIGFLVNPVAGTGGPFGHKGSDDPQLRSKALRQGAIPSAQIRALVTAKLLGDLQGVELVTWGRSMGSDYLDKLGIRHRVLGEPESKETTARDTINASRQMAGAGIELLLFVGGDGTARDILDSIGDSVPVIGVPAGVKMYSAVFSPHPRTAVRAVRRFIDEKPKLEIAEVIDLDEGLLRAGTVMTQLYGYMNVPSNGALSLGTKSPSPPSDTQSIAAIAGFVAESVHSGSVSVLGPGSTLHAIGREIGVRSALLGVDIVSGTEVLVSDGSEISLLEALEARPADRLFVTPIGGQGFILGRGNQQLTPSVLREIGIEKLVIVATPSKLRSLQGRPLLVDTGDEQLDDELSGWMKIIVGRDEVAVYPVRAAGSVTH